MIEANERVLGYLHDTPPRACLHTYRYVDADFASSATVVIVTASAHVLPLRLLSAHARVNRRVDYPGELRPPDAPVQPRFPRALGPG